MRDPALSRESIRDRIARMLDLGPVSVGLEDDLVGLGLQSMQMIKLAAGWRRSGFDVNFADLALVPTVQAWHDLLRERADGLDMPRGAGRGDTAAPAAPVAAAVSAVVDAPTAVTPGDGDPDRSEPFGLAVMQHAYWIGRTDDQTLGGVAAHLYAEFDGAGLDAERLERAVARLVHRHAMLRSQFSEDGTQRVLDAPGLPVWSVTDLRGLEAAEADRRLLAIRDEKTHQRMRADLGKVFDVSLTLLDGARHRLHVDVDMLAADALSYRIMLGDLADFYTRDADDERPLRYSYRRYLADRKHNDAAVRERERAWWREHIPQLPDAPALPLVPEADRVDPLRTVRFEHRLDAASRRRLAERARAYNVTPAMVLASVFAEVVGTWSERQRFLLNVPLFNREPLHADVELLAGDFSSSVMLDADVSGVASALDRARALQRSLHTAAAHAGYPGLDVLRDLGRYRGEPVLAPVVYTSGLDLGELFREEVTRTFGDPVWIISQGPQVVLDAQVVELDGGLLVNWDVREHAFPPGAMAAMFARHSQTIDALLADGSDWNAIVPAALPPEQAVVRARVNDTATPVSGRLLHDGFFEWAARTPDSVAMVWRAPIPAGGTAPPRLDALTYAEVRDRALRVGGALRARGLRPGQSVSVHLPKGPEQVLCALGVLAAGGTYVPVGFDQPDARRAQMHRTGDVVLTLTTADRDGAGVPVLVASEALAFDGPLTAPVATSPQDIAYVIFTSGSTGQPKGVEVPHRAVMNTIDVVNGIYDVGPADRSFLLSALEFDLSAYDIFGMWSAGGSVVVIDEETRRDGNRFADLFRQSRPTVLSCVPGLLDMLLSAAEKDGLGDSLRAVMLGGDWVGSDLPGRLRALVPDCRFAGLGGTTETAIHCTHCEVPGEVPAGWKAVPYGEPLGNVRCRVVNERGQDCPDWVPGELWIGGAGVARGYRNDPDRTADRFVEHDGLRWYRSGDMARYWPDGTLEFLGRRDHQVKIRGYRVELGEVEAALRSVPGVRRAVADLLTSDTGSVRLAAAVSVAADAPGRNPAPGADSLRAALAGLLPPYMVPEHIEVLDDFPLTGNGKLDRRAVHARLARAVAPDHGYAPPENDLEAALADILGRVLSLPRPGVEDDFFGLGGDSVLATALIARVRDWLDTAEATVSDLFAARTVRALARRLAARQSEPGRLEQVATVYVEVAALSDEEALAQAAGGAVANPTHVPETP